MFAHNGRVKLTSWVRYAGFQNLATEELCARWIAVGAWQPLARVHHAQSFQDLYRCPRFLLTFSCLYVPFFMRLPCALVSCRCSGTFVAQPAILWTVPQWQPHLGTSSCLLEMFLVRKKCP